MCDRVIVLVDMDCFYCQVETRLNPTLEGKPLAVVQYNTWKGGGIIAVNYEAREYGVTRHIRGNEAKEKCKDIVLIHVPSLRGKADTTKYRNAGREVVDVLCKFSDCVERASVDEAYLDITSAVDKRMKSVQDVTSDQLPNTFVIGYTDSNDNANDEKRKEAVETWLKNISETNDFVQLRLAMGGVIVEEMRAAVLKETGFKCSAGIAHNKILGKLACGMHKPNRQTILPHSSVPVLYKTLSVKKIRSLGGKFGDTIVEQLGCKVMEDLSRFTEKQLQQRFDEKTGTWLYNIAHGIDNEPVTPRLISKSIGCCKKFPGKQALATKADVEKWMFELASEASERLTKDYEENQRRAKLITVSYSQDIGNRRDVASSRSAPLTSYQPHKIADIAMELLKKSNSSSDENYWNPPLKYLGISVGKFVEENSAQTSKFVNFFKTPAKAQLCDTNINSDKSLPKTTNLDITRSLKSNGEIQENELLHESPVPIKKGRFDNLKLSPSEKQNSFFMKYLNRQNLVKDSCNSIPDKSSNGGFNNTNGECSKHANVLSELEQSNAFKKDEVSSDNSNNSLDDFTKHEIENMMTDESTSQKWVSLSEVFPDPDTVEDDIVEILPSQLRRKLAERRSKNKPADLTQENQKPPSFELVDDIMTVVDIHQEDETSPQFGKKKEPKSLFTCLEDEENNRRLENGTSRRIYVENPFKNRKINDATSTSFKNQSNTNKVVEDLDAIECIDESSNSSSEEVNKYISNRRNSLVISPDLYSDEEIETAPLQEEAQTPDIGIIKETCAVCGHGIPLDEFPEHSDFHLAEKLQKQLNGTNEHPPRPTTASTAHPKITPNKVQVKGKRGRSSKKVVNTSKTIHITSFFHKK